MELGRIVKPSEGQRGAALVEFAILLPLLLVVVMGIIEFGYALAQQLDVRHGDVAHRFETAPPFSSSLWGRWPGAGGGRSGAIALVHVLVGPSVTS